MRRTIRVAGNVRALPSELWDSPMLAACRGERRGRQPVWLMRQAGRYMDHYRGWRSRRSFLELCRDPAACAEVTLHARRVLDVDAAIIFSDILLILQSLGLPLRFSPDDGPQLDKPIRQPHHVDALGDPLQAADELSAVYDAVRLTVMGLEPGIPLIGFCGAPFTLAAYAIEGGGSRSYARTRQFMYRQPEAWHRLCRILVRALSRSLSQQIAAGCSIVQIFDSWAGHLSRADFAEFAAPHLASLVESLPEGVPVILFGHGSAHLIDLIAGCGADVVGLDQFTSLSSGWQMAGGPARVSVQGNLDPCLLLSDTDRVSDGVARLRGDVASHAGHIVNLGHGVMKESDPDLARRLVDQVHAWA